METHELIRLIKAIKGTDSEKFKQGIIEELKDQKLDADKYKDEQYLIQFKYRLLAALTKSKTM